MGDKQFECKVCGEIVNIDEIGEHTTTHDVDKVGFRPVKEV